jgi:hypothetical protein
MASCTDSTAFKQPFHCITASPSPPSTNLPNAVVVRVERTAISNEDWALEGSKGGADVSDNGKTERRSGTGLLRGRIAVGVVCGTSKVPSTGYRAVIPTCVVQTTDQNFQNPLFFRSPPYAVQNAPPVSHCLPLLLAEPTNAVVVGAFLALRLLCRGLTRSRRAFLCSLTTYRQRLTTAPPITGRSRRSRTNPHSGSGSSLHRKRRGARFPFASEVDKELMGKVGMPGSQRDHKNKRRTTQPGND